VSEFPAGPNIAVSGSGDTQAPPAPIVTVPPSDVDIAWVSAMVVPLNQKLRNVTVHYKMYQIKI
jgi:hypothetical protein